MQYWVRTTTRELALLSERCLKSQVNSSEISWLWNLIQLIIHLVTICLVVLFRAMEIELFIQTLHTQDTIPSDSIMNKIQIVVQLKTHYEVAAPFTNYLEAQLALRRTGTLTTPLRRKCFRASKNWQIWKGLQSMTLFIQTITWHNSTR